MRRAEWPPLPSLLRRCAPRVSPAGGRDGFGFASLSHSFFRLSPVGRGASGSEQRGGVGVELWRCECVEPDGLLALSASSLRSSRLSRKRARQFGVRFAHSLFFVSPLWGETRAVASREGDLWGETRAQRAERGSGGRRWGARLLLRPRAVHSPARTRRSAFRFASAAAAKGCSSGAMAQSSTTAANVLMATTAITLDSRGPSSVLSWIIAARSRS